MFENAVEIVRAMATSRVLVCDCDVIERTGALVIQHNRACPLGMALEWNAEREAIRAELKAKGWRLRDDGYWIANERGSLDTHGPIWQDMMIDIDPVNSRRILAAIGNVFGGASNVRG